jgi:hypothetical protein
MKNRQMMISLCILGVVGFVFSAIATEAPPKTYEKKPRATTSSFDAAEKKRSSTSENKFASNEIPEEKQKSEKEKLVQEKRIKEKEKAELEETEFYKKSIPQFEAIDKTELEEEWVKRSKCLKNLSVEDKDIDNFEHELNQIPIEDCGEGDIECESSGITGKSSRTYTEKICPSDDIEDQFIFFIENKQSKKLIKLMEKSLNKLKNNEFAQLLSKIKNHKEFFLVDFKGHIDSRNVKAKPIASGKLEYAQFVVAKQAKNIFFIQHYIHKKQKRRFKKESENRNNEIEFYENPCKGWELGCKNRIKCNHFVSFKGNHYERDWVMKLSGKYILEKKTALTSEACKLCPLLKAEDNYVIMSYTPHEDYLETHINAYPLISCNRLVSSGGATESKNLTTIKIQ